MVIRDAVPADIPAVVEMGREQVLALYGGTIAENPAALTALAERLIREPDSVLFIAEDRGAPVGMMGLFCYPHHLSGVRTVGEVCWWVNPNARGYGVALLKRAERWAAEQGATNIQMMAPDARVGLLYERRGYQLVELSYVKPVEALANMVVE